MNLIRTAIERPSAVVAVVLMVVLFGVVALETIPVQLAPDVNRPIITIETQWGGAAPAEIEREVTIRQEEVLTGISGLADITSRSEQGRARVTLEFDVGTNMDRALLLVANRLDRVTGYPDEADEPTIKTAGAEDSPIAWFIVTRKPGNKRPMHEYGDFVKDVVKDRIERVAGVGEVNVYGGSEREIEIVIEPALLARYRLTVSGVLQALRRANAAISAGDVDEGKRRYVVRTEAELNTLDTIRQVVLRSIRDQTTGRLARVTVADVAKVGFSYKEPTAIIRLLAESALAFNAERETGANVIETMDGIDKAVGELNESIVPGAGLKLRQVYDETVYITSSVQLVRQNIWVGGTLAALILLLFLRSWRATLIVSISIPVSVIGSFVAMAALGRSLNVISLAGLAFAVGMVVDAAIVVLENIFRLREQGKPPRVAAYEGAQQVWGAVLVSALTTVMVFIPVLIMQLEVGQLFRDIAVAISVSVMLSLLVSVTVLPALASRLLIGTGRKEGDAIKRIPVPGIDHLGRGFVIGVLGFVRLITRSRLAALTVVALTSVAAIAGTWKYLPKLEYLPDGNRNLMFGIVIPPPGYNLDTTTKIAKGIEDDIKPFWKTVSGPESVPGGPPKIDRFFFVATRAQTFLGAAAVDAKRATELKDVLSKPVFKEPGTFAIINQLSIFGRGIGGGRKIELDISGPDLESILSVALRATGRVGAVLPQAEGNQFRPNPGLELGAPEVRVTPDRLRLADNGVSARELGEAIDTFNDGLRVAEVTVGNDRLDLMLKGPVRDITATQGVGNLPVVTMGGQIVPVSSMASVALTAGPTEIRHRERERTVTLEIVPSSRLALERAIELIRNKVIAPLRKEGVPAGVKMQISGTADKLTQTWEAMVRDLVVALIIVYLVMAILFESFVYPLIILLSVPLAAAGGVAGLALLNLQTFQPLDMLTLLGFVILVGIVVNNAILLVHQTLFHLRHEGLDAEAAILEATRNRIRPIFMSTLTSVFGMLPLVVFPGAGSELYRGLGSVVVGGLSLSALLTLLIVPPMLTLVVGPLERRTHRRAAELAGEMPAE
ncbi:MAG: efflux RND transporter permease subunit [Methyloligellaceae bacterium]